MTSIDVHTIGFGSEAFCGAALTRAFDDQPEIHLFEISENRGNKALADNLVAGCLAARDQLAPGQALEDILWHFTSSPFHADFTFTPIGAGGYRMTMSSMDLGAGSCLALSLYHKALNDPRPFERAITGGHRFMGHNAGQVIIVPAPKHPSGFYYMSATDNEFETPVLASAEKLMSHWVAQSLQQHQCDDLLELSALYNANAKFMSGDDNSIAPLHSKLETSLEHMGLPNFSNAPEMPRMNYWKDSNDLGFTNGRHRTLNLINAGAPFVPVLLSTNPEDEKEFTRKFGWVMPDAKAPANVVKAIQTAPLTRQYDF